MATATVEFIKIFFIVFIICVAFIGVVWSIIDKKFNYNTLLIICCIVLIITFNI